MKTVPRVPDLVKIDHTHVDLDALHSLAHNCRPELCQNRVFCCSNYIVHVTEEEMNRLVGFMPLAARYSRQLKSGREFRNVFEEEDDGTYLIDTAGGACVFSYREGDGRGLCSVHTAAMDAGRRPADIKPECCTLWPLARVDGRQDVLTVHEDAFLFPCNRRRKSRSARLNRGVRRIVADLWGESFLDRVEKEIQNRPDGKQR